MVIMGIRNMQPYHYLPMQLPYCVFEVSKKNEKNEVAKDGISLGLHDDTWPSRIKSNWIVRKS